MSGRCLLANGQRCLEHAECATDFCQGGKCTPCTTRCTFLQFCHRNVCEPFGFKIPTKPMLEYRRFEGITR